MPNSHHRPTPRRHAFLATVLAVAATTAAATPQAFQVVNASGQPVAMAAVSVLVRGASPKAPPGASASMAQRNKSFEPTVLVVQTGTQVSFPNFDTVRHHVYSFSPTRPFEIKLYSGTPAQPVLFDKAGTATLGCNIHDRMLAYIHVVDTPYFGMTDAQGQVTFELPAGDHIARIWTPAMGEKLSGQESRITSGRGPITLRLTPP